MNAATLASGIRQELLRSPKKTAALGIVVLVAAGFWSPLIKDWLSSDDPAALPEPALVVAQTSAAEPPAEAGSDAAETPSVRSWYDIRSWRKQDPYTSPVGWDDELRNPFQLEGQQLAALAAAEEQGDEEERAESYDAGLSPQEVGLKLTGTLVGPRDRVATINGKVYREKALVVVDPDSPATEAARQNEFTIDKIEPNYVLLSRRDSTYTLELTKPKRNGFVLEFR